MTEAGDFCDAEYVRRRNAARPSNWKASTGVP
jgi:hypothetical protein